MSYVKRHLPYGKHSVESDDISSVIDVLENQFLTQGSVTPKFERALCEYTGAGFAVAVNSGTSGLHIACLAAGIKSGSLVWTVPNSFVASANCALYCGADVDFVDIDPSTRNISIEALSRKLQLASENDALPDALVVVHFSGMSSPMREIRALTQPYGITVIEDAAHALGGTYDGKPIGCGIFSDFVVTSFHPVKSITTAEGGAVLTNDKTRYEQLRLFSSHGITKDRSKMLSTDPEPWLYEQHLLGLNYRLSDVHAALGLSQLTKLDKFVEKRRQIAAEYFAQLAHLPLILPVREALDESAWHIFVVEVENGKRRSVFQHLVDKGVGGNVHYIPIHLQPFYQRLGFRAGSYPHSEKYYENAITIPLFPDMTADDITYVVTMLEEALS
ncbi:UDP-4-amino-4,6-dideoxy-N-acetyl-beta-L-altrosamine transaminase [Aestuariibacter sp. AA17]|uniref:UDP-4-amino-4, 6-dideoxy-N-acetyl-beta-L-altrosamine transaminase n=1 Tax=Fluctibacter corallii TaxID=2984329 RepID=A0ABT3AA09_9ALTE|nr:UDP-4-amino-4,6-dideoxy-N-acetyl-beta-L-altrosamine transaminase [Aestuariibacter sp. AA17]MCV2885463.1 UDP-4-amino-4,6-dideoxy-N-acetyl-beta-L-altrosamine transaminase [Aestuariibacter sp. AA17]